MSAPEPMVIAVGGGKGGVGKSMAAVNLAVAMAQAGRQTVLVDGDLGSPNLHTLLAVDPVPRSIESLLAKDIEHLNDARLDTKVPGLKLIAGSAAAVGSANIAHTQKLKLLRHLHQLKADVVIVDVGAGTSFNTLDLFNTADVRVIVTTPQLTALQNAYAFAKGALFRELKSLAGNKTQTDLLEDPRLNKDAAKLKSLVQQVKSKDEAFGVALRQLLDGVHLYVLGNAMLEEKDALTFQAFSRMVKDFLSVDCEVLGQLKNSRRAHDSVNRRTPVAVADPEGEWSLSFRRFADKLLAQNVTALREARARAEAAASRATAEEPAAPAPLPAELHQYERKHERVDVSLLAKLDGAAVEVKNLSTEGALIKVGGELALGHHAVLDLPDGVSHRVEVRNTPEPGFYGVQFIEALRRAS